LLPSPDIMLNFKSRIFHWSKWILNETIASWIIKYLTHQQTNLILKCDAMLGGVVRVSVKHHTCNRELMGLTARYC